MSRIRNYAAMNSVKLYRCYWELRNGLFHDQDPYFVGGVAWDSSFSSLAYKICLNRGSCDPRGDLHIIEEIAQKRKLDLTGERNPNIKEQAREQAKNIPTKEKLQGLDMGESPPEEVYVEVESEVIEI